MIVNKDFGWSGVNIDYHTDYSCEESGCDEEGICRCGTIYDDVVTIINVSSIVESIYYEYFDDSLSSERNSKLNFILNGISKEIDLYTIDRIVRHFRIYDYSNWIIELEGGDYGQEIGGVILLIDVAKKIEYHLDIALSIEDLSSRIEYLLVLEYGKLLTELEGCSYELIEVDIGEVRDTCVSTSLLSSVRTAAAMIFLVKGFLKKAPAPNF